MTLGSVMNSHARGYLWAELGAILGAIVAGIPAGLAWMLIIGELIFSADWVLVPATGLPLAAVAFGAVFGCRFALRRQAQSDAERTAWSLGAILIALYIVGLWSSDTSLQSDLLPYLAAAAPLSPLAARWLSLRRHENRRA